MSHFTFTIDDKIKEIENWAEAHVTELMRQAHQRMSSQQVGEIALRVMS